MYKLNKVFKYLPKVHCAVVGPILFSNSQQFQELWAPLCQNAKYVKRLGAGA